MTGRWVQKNCTSSKKSSIFVSVAMFQKQDHSFSAFKVAAFWEVTCNRVILWPHNQFVDPEIDWLCPANVLLRWSRLVIVQKRKCSITTSCWSKSFEYTLQYTSKNKTHYVQYIFQAASVCLVFLWYRVRQNVAAAGAGGDVGVSRSGQHRRSGCGRRGLLRMLLLLPGQLPLFGTSILKPDLHL